jgi:phage terminase small subunit
VVVATKNKAATGIGSGAGGGRVKIPAHLKAVPDGAIPSTLADVTPRALPAKPASVSKDDDVSQAWDELVAPFAAADMLSPLDALLLETTARAVVAMRLAHKDLLNHAADNPDHPTTVVDAAIAGGVKKHPAEQVFRSEVELVRLGVTMMGGSLVSRARLSANTKEAEDASVSAWSSPAAGV